MKKRNVLFPLLLAMSIALTCTVLYAHPITDTVRFIIQKDTTICKGVSVQLDLRSPKPKDTMLPGVWKQLISSSSIDPSYFNIKPFGYDRVNQFLYAVFRKTIIRFDLKKNLVTTIPAGNWPGEYSEFVYDFTNNRLLCWRSGRDNVYALPAAGGNWTLIGAGITDNECYGASLFWNPLGNRPGLYGGYGSAQVKSWIYEHDGSSWQLKKNNPAIDMAPPKGGNILASNKDGSKLYLFSGQGNYSGSELTGGCSIGSPWANATGIFCWLKDLWELDLATYQFKNILPVNDPSIQYEGALAYDYDKNRFYLFGGFQPTGDYVANQLLENTNKTFVFNVGKDAGFQPFTGEGNAPPAMSRTVLNNYAYYDPVDKRIIWARYDGIWAYYPDSTTAPKPDTTYRWSTGATTRSINVTPDKTTQYSVTRTIGSEVSKDSINISVINLQTQLKDTLKVCADSVLLDAGTGFTSYAWNDGSTTSTVWAKKTGAYVVTVGDGQCTVKDTSMVLMAAPLVDFTIGAAKDSVCAGTSDSLFINTPQLGVDYTWYVPGNTNAVKTAPYLIVNNILRDTSFVVQAKTSPDVCAAKGATITIYLRNKIAKPIVTDTVSVNAILFKWQPVTGAIAYQVSRDSGLVYQDPSSGPQGLSHIVNALQPNQSIRLWVKAIAAYSCQNSDSVKIIVTTLNPFGEGIYVPNAFTPNGDGVNDVLMVYGTAIAALRFSIYNQWGQLMFSTTDMKQGWDGIYKGNKASTGRYTYAVEALMQTGNKVTKGGSFSLIR